jgi:hypothetical protein
MGRIKVKNEKLKLKNLLFLLSIIFFTGCSQKEINIYAVEKPKALQNKKIRFIKIADIQNDKANLKEKIIQKMKEVNNIVPNYFHINPKNYQSVLSGSEKINKNDTFYYKKIKIIYKKPRCIVTLYPCKEIGGYFFCNYSSPIHYSLKDFNNIQKNSYQNGDYVLINNQIYKKILLANRNLQHLNVKKKKFP